MRALGGQGKSEGPGGQGNSEGPGDQGNRGQSATGQNPDLRR